MKQHNGEALKILLIEDNDIDVEWIRRTARRLSFDLPIIRARNGLEALEILQRPNEQGLKDPYVIFLDINMPLMNGFELLEHLSNNGPAVENPIYILSSSDSEADQKTSRQYKISGYLVKPITAAVLTDIVDSPNEGSSANL